MQETALTTIQTFMPLIVIGAIVLIGLAVAARIRGSEIYQLLSLLSRELRSGRGRVTEEEIAATPRSLSGMDNLYLPKIARDFPEFSWNEWRDKISAAVLEKVKQTSADGNGVIYNTVISRYFKEAGTCSIIAETNASYLPAEDVADAAEHSGGRPYSAGAAQNLTRNLTRQAAKKTAAKTAQGGALRRQAVFETELLYIQDADKASGKALGYNCPNCGAPVRALGQKSCPYCGAAIEPVNIRVWRIAGIKET